MPDAYSFSLNQNDFNDVPKGNCHIVKLVWVENRHTNSRYASWGVVAPKVLKEFPLTFEIVDAASVRWIN